MNRTFAVEAIRVLRSAQTTTYYPRDQQILKELADELEAGPAAEHELEAGPAAEHELEAPDPSLGLRQAEKAAGLAGAVQGRDEAGRFTSEPAHTGVPLEHFGEGEDTDPDTE